MSEAIQGWQRCDLPRCRREYRCASDTFACLVKWRQSQPKKTPEEAAQAIHELKLAIDQERARRAASAERVDLARPKKSRAKKRAAKLRREAELPHAGIAAPAPTLPQSRGDDVPAVAAAAPQLRRMWRKESTASGPSTLLRRAESPGQTANQARASGRCNENAAARQTVIASASEAIQNHKYRLDCFVASLLAMTY